MTPSENIRFSVLIPWCNRDEIHTTLGENAAWLDPHRAEVLVINCGGDSHRLEELLQSSEIKECRHIDIPAERFNKSVALNIGLFLSRTEHILVLDADVILESDFLTQASHIVDAKTFVTVKRVRESVLQPMSLPPILTQTLADGRLAGASYTFGVELSFSDGSFIHQRMFRQDLRDASRAGPGLLCARRDQLVAVGGYNSRLKHWGWEDDDVQLRLRKSLGLHHVELGEALHLSHGDDRRALFGQSREIADMMNFSICCDQYSRGDFSGTYSQDIETLQDGIVEVGGTKGEQQDSTSNAFNPGLGPVTIASRPPDITAVSAKV